MTRIDELKQKFQGLVRGLMPEATALRIIDMVDGLEDVTDIASLMSLLADQGETK